MGTIIPSKSNNISLNYSGMKSGLKGGTNVIGSSSVGNYGSNVSEEYDFDNVSLSLREYSTIKFNPKTIELYLEGFLAKKSELEARLEVATSPEEILELQKEIFMIDFNMYMLNNQKKLYMYQDIANSEEFKNYMADGKISNVIEYKISNALKDKGSISWSDENKMMYSYLFVTQSEDAANEYYDVILDVINRQKGLSSADGTISLTNNSAEVASSFMSSASEIFNNGGVLTSKEYSNMYALIYHTKMEGTYDTTINEMNQLLVSGICISKGIESKYEGVNDTEYVLYNGEGIMNPVAFDKLTSPFGPRIHPTKGVSSFHYGVDLAAPAGTPIYAAMDGVIKDSWYDSKSGGGNSVTITHDGGYQTGYAHMTNYIVSPGQEVKRGQLIGYVGNTGASSTGDHLHFNVKLNGEYLNPEEYVDLNWKPGDDGFVSANEQNLYNLSNELGQLNINVESIIPLNTSSVQGSYYLNTVFEQSNTNVETVVPLVNIQNTSSNIIGSGLEQLNTNVDSVDNLNNQDSNVIDSKVEQVVVDNTITSSNSVTHTISSGDSLYAIAQKYYGDGSRVSEIAAANNISNPNKIYEGQELIIPNVSDINNSMEQVVVNDIPTVSSGVTHRISRGDSLFAIAQKYYGDGSRYTEIATANNISNPNKIYEGQELIIP